MFSLEKNRFRRIYIKPDECEVRPFSVVSSGKTRAIRLKQLKFCLTRYFLLQVVKHCTRLSREVVESLTLDTFKLTGLLQPAEVDPALSKGGTGSLQALASLSHTVDL